MDVEVSNVLLVLIFSVFKIFYGKKIAGILHHSLAFLLLVCAGLHCVVLFFPADKVRRGAWN